MFVNKPWTLRELKINTRCDIKAITCHVLQNVQKFGRQWEECIESNGGL